MPTKDDLNAQLILAHAKTRDLERELRGLRQERKITLEMDGLSLMRTGNGDCYITIHSCEPEAEATVEIIHSESRDMIKFLLKWDEETDG